MNADRARSLAESFDLRAESKTVGALFESCEDFIGLIGACKEGNVESPTLTTWSAACATIGEAVEYLLFSGVEEVVVLEGDGLCAVVEIRTSTKCVSSLHGRGLFD